MSNDLTESDKSILTGRIYPAIQSCVGNRYKIIVGYFAIIGFVLFDSTKLQLFLRSGGAVLTAIIFTLFVLHNTVNYWSNAKEQWRREQLEKRVPLVELLSSIVMIVLIWGGFILLKVNSCAA